MLKKNKKTIGPFLRYVVLPVLLILVITIILNIFIYKLEENFYYNVHSNEIAEITSLINRRFQSAVTSAESAAAFFASSEDVTQEEFNFFALVLTRSVASGAISMQTMIEWVDKENIIRYAYPIDEKNKEVIGLDLNQYPNRLEPIIKSKETRSEVVSEPIMFVEGYPGILIYSPIFRDAEYLGEIIIAVRLSDLLSPIFGETPNYSKDRYIQTDNFIMPFSQDVILNSNGERVINAAGDTVKDLSLEKYVISREGVISKNMFFVDKTWQFKFYPTYADQVNVRALFYAGFSLVFVSILGILLWVLQKRRDQIAEQSQKNLEISQFLDSIIENIPNMIFLKDAKDLKFVKFNKAGEQILGLKREELIGKSDMNFFPPKQAEFFIREDRSAIQNKKLIDIPEESIITKNGPRLLHTKKITILDAKGDPTFLLGISEDITEQKRLSAKAEALISGIGDGMVAIDKNKIITYVNKKAEDLSGFSAEDAVGKNYYDFWILVDDKGKKIVEEKRPFHQAIIDKQIIVLTVKDHFYFLRKDGSRFPISSTISPIIVNGEVEGSIMLFRDITKESDVDRMKTEILSLTTHQLLTPSNAIKWTSELLLDGDYGPLKPKQKVGIKNIYTSNESMIGLIHALLNISRIESGRITVNPKPTYLPDIVKTLAQELKNRISAKKQVFIFEPDKDLPKVNIDINLISEVYKNFLTNAIKYTPEKGKITLSISKVGDSIISKVTDTGYGIPEADQHRVFQKFYRGENILSIEKDGNGLGLYLVKQIVEVSGGKVGFESKEGKGTTFWFSLPLAGSISKVGEVTIS